MGKKGISIVIALIILAIIAVFVIDYQSKRPDKLGGNPYEFNVSEYEKVDASLLHYKEIKNIQITHKKSGGIDLLADLIYITGENFLQVINTAGVEQMFTKLNGDGTCVKASDEFIFVGFFDHIEKYSAAGELVSTWDSPDEKCVFTSLALMDEVLYVADAGNRRVLRYDLSGNVLGEFEGKAESAAGHGFIVPSANFDLAVNSYGELWVVNPGKHAVENYSDDGVLRGFWHNGSMTIEGFSGCCNPAEMAVMEDGSFITSEKGLVRIKVYDQSGKLQSVVAPPDKFDDEGKAPEVTTDKEGRIYALDFDRNMIRVFEKK